MKPPKKPRWKKWLMAGAMALGVGGSMATGTWIDGINPFATYETPPPVSLHSENSFTEIDRLMPSYNQAAARFHVSSVGMDIAFYQNNAGVITGSTPGNFVMAPGDAYLHMDNERLLRAAASFEDADIVKYLISKNADIHANNDEALRYAANFGHLETVKALVDAGANINAENGEALRNAVNRGHGDVAQYLLDKGALVDQKMIDNAELTDKTADLSMQMTQKLKAAQALQGKSGKSLSDTGPMYDSM